MCGCTLSMARLLLGNHLSVSLDSVRQHFGMPLKRTPYHKFKNKTWEQLDHATREELAEGACDEVESIWDLFVKHLAPQFPTEEYDVVDMIIRMFTQPVLTMNIPLLQKLWVDEETKKASRLQKIAQIVYESYRERGVDVLPHMQGDKWREFTEKELQSVDKFAELLRFVGEEPEMKTTAKGNENYAFAKTDPYMRDYLLEHEDDDIRQLAEARLGVKSTILQTRAENFGRMAERGACPVYLRYCGASTLRPSGGDGANWLNLKRRSTLRKSVGAPKGFWLAPVDASQIECRVLHYLAGGADDPVIEMFRNGGDPYAALASKFYNEQIYKPKDGDPRKEELEAKRGLGKQGILSCGYGASGRSFKLTAKNGTYGPPVDVSDEEADEFVRVYRTDNPSICMRNHGYWAQAGRMLARLAGGDAIDWGPLHVANHRIYVGPGRLPMIYDTLEYFTPSPDEAHNYRETEQNGFWRLKTKSGWKTMWGSKLTQNICEGVSRVIVSRAMSRIKHMYGIRTLNWPYDELLLLIPRHPWAKVPEEDTNALQLLEACLAEMKREPEWLPGLPLDAEGALGEQYDK